MIDRVIGVGAPAPRPTGPNLSPEAKAVLEAVADGFDTCEAVSIKLGMETAEVEAELARLEVAGYLACSLLGQYSGLGTWTAQVAGERPGYPSAGETVNPANPQSPVDRRL